MNSWLAELVDGVKAILPQGFHLYLFGSQANGFARPSSDVDLGILGDRELPVGIMTRLENLGDSLPTLDKMDWVDLTRVSGAFREQALKNAIQLI